MTASPVTLNGYAVTGGQLHVPGVGAWFADLDLADDAEVSGAAVLTVGDTELRGTVSPAADGTFGARRRTRIVAGAGGWGTSLAARHYHNDAGVRAATVAEDAARDVGESLASFAGAAATLGADYVRRAGTASTALEGAAGGADWWVDYDGQTHVGTRPVATAGATGSYAVVDYHPRERLLTVALSDLTEIGVGSVVSDPLDEPQTVRAFSVEITAEGLTMRAWCGEGRQTRLLDSLRAIVAQALGGRLYAIYRYRVVQQAAESLNLQAASKAPGLPDLLTIRSAPGLPGVAVSPQVGTECFVSFVEGDPTQPVVIAYQRGTDGTLAEIARKGDTVEVVLGPAVFNGTILIGGTPSPAAGVLTWAPPKTLGTITTGSTRASMET